MSWRAERISFESLREDIFSRNWTKRRKRGEKKNMSDRDNKWESICMARFVFRCFEYAMTIRMSRTCRPGMHQETPSASPSMTRTKFHRSTTSDVMHERECYERRRIQRNSGLFAWFSIDILRDGHNWQTEIGRVTSARSTLLANRQNSRAITSDVLKCDQTTSQLFWRSQPTLDVMSNPIRTIQKD